MSCDFVPGVCEATAIVNCLVNRECQLNSLGPESLKGSGVGLAGSVFNSIGEVTLQINELNVCLLLAITQAFLKAGCPMPVVDPNLPEFDPSECIEEMDQQVSEALDDPLGHLKDFFTITYDDSGKPIRIQT